MALFPQNPSHHIKNIGFISTRIAGTDGVSLELQKWAEVLERNRYSCFYLAGELDRPEEKSSLVEEAHFDHPLIQEINDEVFEISALDLSFMLNTIPTARVKLCVGNNARNYKELAQAHTKLSAIEGRMPIKIYVNLTGHRRINREKGFLS